MRQPFDSVSKIYSITDQIILKEAVCSDCHGKAIFSKNITPNPQVYDVGSSDKYKSTCRKCFFKI